MYGTGAEPIEMLRSGRIDALPYDIFGTRNRDDIIHEPRVSVCFVAMTIKHYTNYSMMVY